VPSARLSVGYLLAKITARDDKLLLTIDVPFVRQFLQLLQMIPLLKKLIGIPESIVDMTFYYADIKYVSLKRYFVFADLIILNIENHSNIKNIVLILSKKCMENLLKTLKEHKIEQR